MKVHPLNDLGTRRNTSSSWSAVAEVFVTFLKLGLTSFGGPIAHFGYFRRELVEQGRWVDDSQYAQLLALCQFLPGPASSQLGFSLGLLRAGWSGAIAAFLAFTLPSALMLLTFAALLPQLSGATGSAAIHGLKLVALVVVAQGVLGMTRQLCPDTSRRMIATAAAVILLLAGGAWMQLLVVTFGALAGLGFCRDVPTLPVQLLPLRYGTRCGGVLLGLFALLLASLPLASSKTDGLIAVAEAFYRAGALVFGGGMAVLADCNLPTPTVDLVTLVGKAGTGKTLLAIAAGLHCRYGTGAIYPSAW